MRSLLGRPKALVTASSGRSETARSRYDQAVPIKLIGNIGKNLVAPHAHRFLSRRGTYGLDADPREATAVFDTIEKALQRADRDFRDQAVLELGPGRSPELARLALARGASHYCAVDTRLQLAAEMFDRGDDDSVTLLEYNGRTIPLRTQSIDVVFSKSVLEHVRAGLIAPLLAECRRVLRAGGTMVHVIDLRDHLHINGDHEVTGDWLEALRYSDDSFRAMFSKRSTYINRLRACEWRMAFSDAGFAVVGWATRTEPLGSEFDGTRLQDRWARMPLDELRISWVTATVTKPD